MKITAIIVLSAGLLSLGNFTAPISTAIPQAGPDAHRLRTGRFTYRSLDHGKDVGKGHNTIRRLADSGNYAFSEVFDFSKDFKGYRSQRWESIATSEFEPISATLSFGEAPSNTPVFDLKYTSGRVTGFAISRKDSGHGTEGTKRSIDAALPANTVDQRIDWATVLASDLESGKQFEFNVYDPGTGVSRAIAEVGPLERVQVPAGSFLVYRVIYRIEKAGGTERYQVLASRDLPRVLVREEFPNGAVDELMEMSGDVALP